MYIHRVVDKALAMVLIIIAYEYCKCEESYHLGQLLMREPAANCGRYGN